MNRTLGSISALFVVTSLVNCVGFARREDPRPNILWISAEDISPHLGCYGDPHAITPNLDQLAKDGVRYSHAFTTAGVCAPCRSGIITGMYQTTLGTHHMRCRAKLPKHVRPFPTYLREAGYYTTNNSKKDYQFATPADTWDESSPKAHWRNRSKNQPFFAVFNFTGCHESGIANDEKYREVTQHLRPNQRQHAERLTTLPPYYPDTPRVREDWKRNYELITAMDAWAGDLIGQLKADGLYDDTIIMFWSDHGVGLPRAKRWLYDSGTHIPLVIRLPARFRTDGQGKSGSVVDDLISSIDLGPTVLNLAGIKVPLHIQGRAFLGENLSAPRDYVFGARDRMDERYDIIRMVRDRRFKYLRNYEPLKVYFQKMETPEGGATMQELRLAHAEGRLPPAAALYFQDAKPVEELYDTASDPHEINNLASDPSYADTLLRMRKEHLDWVARSLDLGLIAEPILAQREQQIDGRYSILREPGRAQLAIKIASAAVAASAGKTALPKLMEAVQHEDAAVRYWGAVGMGNLGEDASSAVEQLQALLNDQSNAVRIAAARALCRMDHYAAALATLGQLLEHGAQWERLQAAIVLDELEGKAATMSESMLAALSPRTDLYARGKYTVRVIQQALSELDSSSQTAR
ncbi:sulfatase-like hydrolase/transferase [Pirellulales bacterium]|nr:sulfatase-like hydrolase/transferase [Pirellulales bacterium]